ncbi:hypothetical protein [Curtobacterium sp. MCBD17_008]|uniref:hypothetical protein n=1 Tax=Curtobacterium sp. MCBD17_008 TaxID=2175656 RepID=UPI000DA7BD02|nr:hypothetical protein [Curtobacterium sp. MCBD17_008]PZE90894.1 hypothetical protein DEI95_11120 [Curtobacterium sp. MCBD17_008]
MSRTDDDAAARARLERIAWGAASTPTEAARARIALADLDQEARRRPRSDVAPATSSGADGRRAAARPASRRGRSAGPEGDPTDDDAVIPGVGGDADVRDPGEHRVDDHRADDHRADDQRVGGDGVGEGGVAVGGADDGGADRDAPDRGGSGLLAGARRLADRARRTDRTVLWASGAGAVVVGLVLGTGVGLSVGARSAEPGRATVTPAAGTVTVEQMLDLPQTFADQLPGSIEAPVALRSTRLVFTNRSLSGDAAGTPWNVWAAVGRDPSTICLVATADRIEGTSACYPREDALHGTVSLSATSASGTLWVRLVGGAVRGTVTSTATSRMY